MPICNPFTFILSRTHVKQRQQKKHVIITYVFYVDDGHPKNVIQINAKWSKIAIWKVNLIILIRKKHICDAYKIHCIHLMFEF